MNRSAVVGLAIALVLSACMPLPFAGQPTVAPVAETPTTDVNQAATFAAATLNALPTPTSVLAMATLTATAPGTGSATATTFVTETLTPDPNLTTSVTLSPTIAGATTPAAQINATATETLHPRFFGTLPPAIPYGKVQLVNRAKAEVYVSLQCRTLEGQTTIIEYPVFGRLRVSAPAGRYNYVAWVGGRQFQGSFSLGKGEELSITFNKDKVTVK